MAKIPKDIRDRILDECGADNLILALASGLSGGSLIFVITLSLLLKNNKEER